MIDVFRKPSRSFLMPPAGEPLRPQTVIDISHESLMRVWERLRSWVDDEAQSAQMYRRLAETARLHAADKADLWRGRDLEGALLWREAVHPTQLWAERYAPGFDAAMAFLDKGVAAREAEVAERVAAERRTAEAEQEKVQTRRKYRRALIGLVVVLVAVIAVALEFFLISRANAKEVAAARREQAAKAQQAAATAQQAAATAAIASAKESQKEANLLQSSVKKQIVETGELYAGAREAVRQYSIVPARSLDRPEVAHRFDALTRVTALAQSTPKAERSEITVEYFFKPTDAADLGAALTELGFEVDRKEARNPNVTNALWYGSEVPEESVKLVAYALIRAGYDLVAIQPQSDPKVKPKVIQVGHNGRLQSEEPFTAELIAATPLAELRRVEVAEKRPVKPLETPASMMSVEKPRVP